MDSLAWRDDKMRMMEERSGGFDGAVDAGWESGGGLRWRHAGKERKKKRAVWARGKRTRGAARKKTGQHAESGREEECYYEEREGKKIEREKIRLAAHVQREERRGERRNLGLGFF